MDPGCDPEEAEEWECIPPTSPCSTASSRSCEGRITAAALNGEPEPGWLPLALLLPPPDAAAPTTRRMGGLATAVVIGDPRPSRSPVLC